MPAIGKHIGRIAILTALLTLAGIYGYYSAREGVAKWAFAHQTEFGVDALIRIVIAQTDLSRQTDFLVSQEEFAWQGDMVDVLHREVRSDTLYIYGFRDEAETELKREAPWLYYDTNHPDSLPDAGAKRAKWFSPFVLPDVIAMALKIVAYLTDYELVRLDFFLCLQRLCLEVPSPPPDLL